MPNREKPRVPQEYVPWVNLAGEVIKVTVADYKKAIKKDDKLEIKKHEKWFRSKYFKILSMGLLDPEYIIDKARQYGAGRRKWKWTRKI